MKIKTLLRDFPFSFSSFFISLVFIVITFIFKPLLALFELLTFISIFIIFLKFRNVISSKSKSISLLAKADLSFLESDNNKFFIPVAVCNNNCEIIWTNSLFDKNLISEYSISVNEFSDELVKIGFESLVSTTENGVSIIVKDEYFSVFSHKLNESLVALYFFDITKYRHLTEKYINTRPVVMIITIDNLNDIQQNYTDYDCEAIINGIQKNLSDWLKSYPCFFTKFGDSKFYVVCELQNLDDMKKRNFDILDIVRDFTYDNKFVGASLSIGVGSGNDICDCENNAKLALDLSVGRGGDQAAVKEKDNYVFFGGVNNSVENSNKARSRSVASAISDLIADSDNVLIVGHKYSDFDSIGSSLGILSIVQSLGVNCHIVSDRTTTLAESLLDYAVSQKMSKLFIKPARAKSLIKQSKHSLLFIVDTHIKSFVEFPELLDDVSNIAVIDHHRKSVDYISDATVFFLDPAASSTSEMVTELIEYSPGMGNIGSCISDALLSGIMLDTKNFILRTNSRTFEAAAFLRKNGADTIRVKKLFSSNSKQYLDKNEILSKASTYLNCAFVAIEKNYDNIRLLSSQVADELLNIDSVDASFVIFNDNDKTCVSARSYGKVNVQLIMEKFGGGGHQTMAAAQVTDITPNEILTQIKSIIEKLQR